MKCLIIHGSYRKGNTYKVSQLVKAYMKAYGPIEFEEVFLGELGIPFCIGCNQCFSKGEHTCPHSAIIQPIADKIMACDALIITTPTYALQVPALLKCWLDHMAYYFHRPTFFTKKALVISTTAGSGARSTAHYLKDVLQFWGFNHISILPLRCFSFDYRPDIKALNKIGKTTSKFYAEITSNKLYSPSLKRLFLFNFWRSMAKSGQADNTADFLYWSKMDLLDQSYPPGLPLGRVKKTWAILFSKFLSITTFSA